MRPVLALALSAGACWAEPWIDYARLLEENSSRVITTIDESGQVTRQIDFGDGVVVTCTKDGCVGMDMNGAVGCAWSIYSALRAVAEVCNIPEERMAGLVAAHRRLTTFVATNAVPPRSEAEIEGYHRREVELYRTGQGADGPLDCAEATAPGSDVMLMLEGVTGQLANEATSEIDTLLASPRLPVMNPCL